MLVKSCERCNLSKHCKSILKPRGEYKYPIIVIGEASGEVEDDTGVPFVGDSGKMLERVFASVGLESQDFFITNLVRCRPERNRTPSMNEIKSCYRYLYREIRSRKPNCIVLLGNSPLKFFLGSDKSISNCCGKYYHEPLQSPVTIKKRGKKRYTEEVYCFMPLYHPSALLRNNSLDVGSPKWEVWQSVIKLQSDFELLG